MKKQLLTIGLVGSNETKEAEVSITPTQINAFFNHLMGEVLTIVEASTTDEIQRKALKSVVGNLIHSRSVELQQ